MQFAPVTAAMRHLVSSPWATPQLRPLKRCHGSTLHTRQAKACMCKGFADAEVKIATPQDASTDRNCSVFLLPVAGGRLASYKLHIFSCIQSFSSFYRLHAWKYNVYMLHCTMPQVCCAHLGRNCSCGIPVRACCAQRPFLSSTELAVDSCVQGSMAPINTAAATAGQLTPFSHWALHSVSV